MDTEPLLVREDHRGQEEGGGLGPGPRSPSTVFAHHPNFGRRAEFFSQGRGEGLPGQPWGKLDLEKLTQGPSRQGEAYESPRRQ